MRFNHLEVSKSRNGMFFVLLSCAVIVPFMWLLRPLASEMQQVKQNLCGGNLQLGGIVWPLSVAINVIKFINFPCFQAIKYSGLCGCRRKRAVDATRTFIVAWNQETTKLGYCLGRSPSELMSF